MNAGVTVMMVNVVPSRTQPPMIRGSIIRMGRAWVEQTYGPEVIDHALREIPPDDADAIGGMLLAASMYPLESWNRFLAALAG